jgi:predicted amidohydrolase YtcJ
MPLQPRILAAALASLLQSLPGLAALPEPVLVIHSLSAIRTGNPAADRSLISGEGLAVSVLEAGGRRLVSEIGPSSRLLARCVAPLCQSIDAAGGVLLPGLHDAHAHQSSAGAASDRVAVRGSSLPEIQQAVRAFAEKNPESAWILGRGWNAAGFGTRFPTAADLDAAVAGRPVLLLDSDGHQVWANTAAIRAAGITRDTQDPEGGTILRDAEGNPSGMFLEMAGDLIWEAVPDPSPAQLEKYIIAGEIESIRAGFTSHHGGPVGVATIEAHARLDARGLLRQNAYLWADLEASEEGFTRIVELDRSLPRAGRVHISAFKGFVDGVISSYTGALVDPYADAPETRGEAAYSQEELNASVLRANAAGYPVALHAIGDLAVRMALDAFEESSKILGHSLINRIEHIEVVHPLDVPRFARLRVAASMQPSHMHFGSESSSYYDDRLGRERLAHAFAWGELERAGALLLFGTDAPVVDQDSVEALHCAVERTYRNGTAFELQNRVSEAAAVAAFTSNPALSLGFLKDAMISGELVPGGVADLVIYPKDPLEKNGKNLRELAPVQVFLNGHPQL